MMDLEKSKIWKKLKEKCDDDRELVNIQEVCGNAIDLTKTIRDTFPNYTLHDEKHICNVVRWMEKLLDDSGIEKLSAGECAMLLLAACYHDIGMCYTEEQRQKELKSARFSKYLEENPGAFLAVVKSREAKKEIPEEIQADYFRKIHSLRVHEQVPEKWEITIVSRDKLIAICKSHGANLKDVAGDLQYDKYLETDYVLCAILLRLADILDFDVSRAPQVLYEYQKINAAGDSVAAIEWKKHQASRGFKFIAEKERVLAYRAVCDDMQEEYEIRKFLDYVEEELKICGSKLKEYGQKRWQEMQIPEKVERYIEGKGYQSGEYCLTLEADNVLALLVGDDLYRADSTFIRELLQNALDAVRARRAVDRRWNQEEKDQIVLSNWIDPEGFQWFRIDDRGIGMTEQTILNFFLRVGRSYYQSDEFQKLKYDNKRYYDFSPISQFGIGILSCFLKGDRMEVSTRHYDTGKGIRFGMKGTKGYYSLAAEEKGDRGTPMPCADAAEKENFRQSAGTAIAVRIKESLSENIENSIKSYLCYPDVCVCYKKGTELIAFPTEQELLEFVKKTREIRIPFPAEFMRRIHEAMPDVVWEEQPYVCMKCIPLDEISESPFISGAKFEIDIAGRHNAAQQVMIDEFKVERELVTRLAVTKSSIEIRMFYQFGNFQKGINMELTDFERQYRNQNETVRWCAAKFDKQEKLEDILKEIPQKARRLEIERIYRDLEKLSEMIKANEVYVVGSIPFYAHADFNAAMERFILPRCDSGTRYISNNKVEKVYHGICFETAWENVYLPEESNFAYTALLLSGEFQPQLGISRDQVRCFPMKAAGCIELLGKRIFNSGLSCYYPSYYGNMEYGCFAELVNDAAFCSLAEKTLEVRYEVSVKEIKERMTSAQGKEALHFVSFSDVFDIYSYNDCGYYFLDILLRVLLQKEFEIYWDFSRNRAMEYFAVGIRKDEISEAEKVLLPMTFVRSLHKNTEFLTQADVMGRYALNADHPFSVWLMKHAVFLEKKHKSLWKRIRKNICKLSSERMVAEVNAFLKEIQKREAISIPDNVWLKESDFLEL